MRFAFTLSLLLGAGGFAVAQSKSVIVQSPAKDDTVAKVDEVKGICAVKGAVPVVFVKPLDGTEWYVQPAATLDGAKFKVNAHFGEAACAKGTRFKIVVVAIPTDKVKGYTEGDKVAALPDYPASDPITVTR